MAGHARRRGETQGRSASPFSSTAQAGWEQSLRQPGRDWSTPSRRFGAATTRLVSGAPVIAVTGDVDLASAPTLRQTLLDLTGEPTGEVIVDLTDCTFLDSRGLSALLAARESLGRSGRPLSLVLSNPNMLKIFRATGLDERFEIYPTMGAVGERSHE